MAKAVLKNIQQKSSIKDFLVQMNDAFPERREVIETMIDATIAGEHVLLLGPPGTAKSLLIRTFAESLGDEFFETLITRYTEPNELFGPYSLKAYEEDRYARTTAGYAPPAKIWFLDEVFKGSSAILNSMLTAINERRMRDDGKWVDLPLRLCVGASNELPGDNDGLAAFHDRFLVRHLVKYVEGDDAFRDVMWGNLPKVTAQIDPAELDALAKLSEKVTATDEVAEACRNIRDAMREKNVSCSDRRWFKAGKLLAARAARLGRTEVTSTSLGLLEHVLWSRPEEIPMVREIVRAHVATWLRELRESTEAIDEQEIALKEALRKGGTIDKTATAIAQVGQRLTEIQEESLEAAKRDSPEAAKDVEHLEERILDIRDLMRKSMRKLGF